MDFTNYGNIGDGGSSAPGQAVKRGPTLQDMFSLSTGTYQGLFKNSQQAKDFRKYIYMNMHKRAPANCNDYPRDDDERRQLVKGLVNAAQDCTRIYEDPTSRSFKKVQQRNYLDVEWESVIWTLLESIEDAQKGICNLPNYIDCGRPAFDEYNTFTDRYNAVLEALRTSKALSESLFKGEMVIHRLAWRPKKELAVKAHNKELNDNIIARNPEARRDTTLNENGDMPGPDDDSNGTRKRKFDEDEDQSPRVQKKSNNGGRATFANQINSDEINRNLSLAPATSLTASFAAAPSSEIPVNTSASQPWLNRTLDRPRGEMFMPVEDTRDFASRRSGSGLLTSTTFATADQPQRRSLTSVQGLNLPLTPSSGAGFRPDSLLTYGQSSYTQVASPEHSGPVTGLGMSPGRQQSQYQSRSSLAPLNLSTNYQQMTSPRNLGMEPVASQSTFGQSSPHVANRVFKFVAVDPTKIRRS